MIAAIEAEQARAEKPNWAAAPPPARHPVLRQLPERQRVVQQLPERPAPPQPAPRALHDDLSLDPLLTKLFGPDDRALPQPRRGRNRARRTATSTGCGERGALRFKAGTLAPE